MVKVIFYRSLLQIGAPDLELSGIFIDRVNVIKIGQRLHILPHYAHTEELARDETYGWTPIPAFAPKGREGKVTSDIANLCPHIHMKLSCSGCKKKNEGEE